MKISNWNIGRRIAFGFGLVLALLAGAGLISYFGVTEIVKNAGEVIQGNRLDGILAQKEVDHLNWANKVNTLLTDEKTTKLNVQTDDHQCGFGQWLFGEGRQRAEALVPSLAPLLKEIEAPHHRLHESAKEIGQVFRQPHQGLSAQLADLMAQHVAWTEKAAQALVHESAGMSSYQSLVRNAVDQALSVVKSIAQNESLGDVKTRQKIALSMIKAMRYGPENKDYIWINDSRPVMIMHPFKPALDGQNLSNFKDPKGKRIFQVFADVCRASGAGFVDYLWPKPGSDKPVPKISYVALYAPWDWVLGTGVYLDEKNPQLLQRAEDYAAGKPFSLGVQLDPTKCGLGRWLAKPETQALMARFPELAQAIQDIKLPHQRLHESGREITKLVNEGNMRQAMKVYDTVSLPAITKIKAGILSVMEAEDALAKGYNRAATTYATQTIPALHQVQKLLADVRREAKKNIMTDRAMLSAAQRTKLITSLVSLAAILIGLILAFIVSRSIIKPIHQAIDSLEILATGDLTTRMEINSRDELGQMSDQFNHFISELNESLGQVQASADQVNQVTEEISSGNQELSDRVQNQASAIEEAAATLEEIHSQVKANADHAESASKLADSAAQKASEGGRVVDDAVAAMGQVQDSSHKINEIIDVVNEIAFQTNLLALNASVEAARAGEAGRGFAVVAGEVRNLAGRSADAAKEIQTLIKDSGVKIDQGSQLVNRSGETLTQIISQVQEVAGTIGEISASAQEQSEAIAQINIAVAQLDEMTQQNASMVEETASAAEEMSAEAAALRQMVARFKLDRDGQDKVAAVRAAASGQIRGRASDMRPSAKAIPSAAVVTPSDSDDLFDADDLEEFEKF